MNVLQNIVEISGASILENNNINKKANWDTGVTNTVALNSKIKNPQFSSILIFQDIKKYPKIG